MWRYRYSSPASWVNYFRKYHDLRISQLFDMVLPTHMQARSDPPVIVNATKRCPYYIINMLSYLQ
jgi:hypothetical protein